MSLLQTLRIAFRALLLNKLRSFLTMLGIIIGVGAVIAMVAIGEGAKAQVEASFAAMGTNLLILMPGSSMSGGSHGGFGSKPTLTWEDLKAIQTDIPAVRAAAPQLRSSAQVMSEDQNWSTTIVGTTPEYFSLRSWTLDRGMFFGYPDVQGGAKVAVLGMTVVEKLYGSNVDPIGQTLRIKNTPFQVIGVLGKKGQSPMGQDYDDTVLIPRTTFQAKIQGGLQKYVGGTLMVGVRSGESMARTQGRITALLRDRHHLVPGAEDDFSIRDLTEMANAQQEGTKTMTALLASIAAVSLLVGGIGVMNIMLVSVTERTREIGLRMAIGAQPGHILAQFLVEAIVLAIAGGILGVGIGIFCAQQLAAQFGWPVSIRLDIILIAVGFSALVGVGFGIYPAQKAARLNPIDALRFE